MNIKIVNRRRFVAIITTVIDAQGNNKEGDNPYEKLALEVEDYLTGKGFAVKAIPETRMSEIAPAGKTQPGAIIFLSKAMNGNALGCLQTRTKIKIIVLVGNFFGIQRHEGIHYILKCNPYYLEDLQKLI